MSERVGAHARVAESAQAGTGQSSAALYIINLLSSTTPMTLEVPYAPELEGFAVFRSRRVEDGRDRFRLHLGYFESPREAQRVLEVVRARYPAAWVALAPADSMGSLDDTSAAQFKLIRHGRAPAPSAQPLAPVTPAKAAAPVSTPKPTAASVPTLRATPVKATLVAPQSRRPATPSVAARPTLSPKDVLQLLEQAPRATRKSPIRQMTPVKSAAPAPAVSVAPQKFAVQLIWSTDPVDAASVPQLAIFDAYTLYTVQVERAGRRWHGLRLGFFTDPMSARQVALYARSDFSAAAVVPVSERECSKAGEIAAAQSQRTSQAVPAAKKDTDTIELKTDDTPRTRSAPLQESLLAPVMPVSTPTPRPIVAKATTEKPVIKGKQIVPDPYSKEPRRKPRTAQDLLEELGAGSLDLDLSCGGRDELSDTGVRHLSVSVVHRKSTLGKLLERVGRRRNA
jgi:hypothetical protein